jgi:hypothetical protein
MPAAEKPRQNGAHHSEAPVQGKSQTMPEMALGHATCIAIWRARRRRQKQLKHRQYFRLFNEYLLYYAIYLISFRQVLNYSIDYCIHSRADRGKV